MTSTPNSTAQRRFITGEEFADLARLSRRQIDRSRVRRPACFLREYELGSSASNFAAARGLSWVMCSPGSKLARFGSAWGPPE